MLNDGTQAPARAQFCCPADGHCIGLVVDRGSFEITVIVHPDRLERRLEMEIGANVLQLE